MKLSPYQRIIRAARRSTGVHLSAEDVGILASDTAIKDRAGNDDEYEYLPDCEDCRRNGKGKKRKAAAQ